MRIDGAESSPDPEVAETFDQQVSQWGSKLQPYKLYARRPSIFKAVIGMWGGLAESGLIDAQLTALINRRVAALNGCVF